MITTKRFFPILFAVGVILFGTGCSKEYLDTRPSTNFSDAESYEDVTGVEGLLSGMHNRIYMMSFYHRYGAGEPSLMTQLDFMTDNVINSAAANHMGAYRWDDFAENDGAVPYYLWRYYYYVTMMANHVVAAADQAQAANEEEQEFLRRARGEALTVRAHCLFQLTQIFGPRFKKGEANDAPAAIIRTNTEPEDKARSTVAECYNQVNADLKEALEILAGKDGVSKEQIRADRNSISYPVVCGIAARVAMAQGEYDKAIAHADEAINAYGGASKLQKGMNLITGFNSVVKNSEWMWAYRFSEEQNNYYVSFGATYSYNYAGYQNGLRFAINRDIYDEMGDKDVRRKWFVRNNAVDPKDPIPANADMAYFSSHMEGTGQCIKYATVSQTSSMMDLCMMRLAEMYYIKAEAQAQLGNVADAVATLSEIMITRDEDYAYAGSDQQEVINEVLRNKQIDHFWEGTRFFDMKRLGITPDKRAYASNIDYMTAAQAMTFVSRNSGGMVRNIPTSPDDKRWCAQIPIQEMQTNPLCVQNPH